MDIKIDILYLILDKINEFLYIKNKQKSFDNIIYNFYDIINNLNYDFKILNIAVSINELIKESSTNEYVENNYKYKTFIHDNDSYHQQSIKYHRDLIKNDKPINSIILLKLKNKYIIIDGCHRIFASYLENKQTINSYIIYL
jgi:hypothetical protein